MGRARQVELFMAGITDTNGNPVNAGKVYSYDAGTTNPRSLYLDKDKSSSASNPAILDADGKKLLFADGSYKFIIKTSADVTLYTYDNLTYKYDDAQAEWGGTSTGAGNSYDITLQAAVPTLSNGDTFRFKSDKSNTGAATLSINGATAWAIRKGDGTIALSATDIKQNEIIEVVADVTNSRFLLIQRPHGIYTTWVPVLGASGAMTYTGTTTNYARYKIDGNTCDLQFAINGTTGGVADTSITISLPLTPASLATSQIFPVSYNNGGWDVGHILILPGNSTAQIRINTLTGNWGLGANREVVCGGIKFAIA